MNSTTELTPQRLLAFTTQPATTGYTLAEVVMDARPAPESFRPPRRRRSGESR